MNTVQEIDKLSNSHTEPVQDFISAVDQFPVGFAQAEPRLEPARTQIGLGS